MPHMHFSQQTVSAQHAPVAAHHVVLCRVPNHDALLGCNPPGVADVQQRCGAGLVGELTLAGDGRQEGRHGQVVLVEVVHAAGDMKGTESVRNQ